MVAIDGYYRTAETWTVAARPAVQVCSTADLRFRRSTESIPRGGRSNVQGRGRHVRQGRGRQDHIDRRAGRGAGPGGQNVVVVDFDVGLRNLDLIMGAERRVVFDLVNVVQGDAKLPQALIRDKRLDNLPCCPPRRPATRTR